MKVPHSVVGRTRPSQQPLGYIDGSGMARGISSIGNVGEALNIFGNALAQRDQQTKRFGAIVDFNGFETQAAKDLDELKRQAKPDGGNFAAMAEASFDNSARKFVSTLDPSVQEEFNARVSGLRSNFVAEAMKFQYDQQDAFYRQGVDAVYQKALTGLDPTTGGDPKNLTVWRGKVQEALATTDLSEIEKQQLLDKMTRGMEGVVYKNNYKAAVKAGGGKAMSFSPAVNDAITSAANKYGVDPQKLSVLAWIESRGNPNARSSTGAEGLFQFTQGTARQYGLTNRSDPVANADAAARLYKDNENALRKALGREPTLGEVYLAHQQGSGGAIKLLQNPDAPAVDVVGDKAVMVNGGNTAMTARQFAAMWINKANNLAGQQVIDADPQYSNLPYEDRVALRSAAESDAIEELNRDRAAAKAEHDRRLNDLYNALNDGLAKDDAIEGARQDGWLTDNDEIRKAQSILNARNENEDLIAYGLDKVNNNDIWNLNSEKDKKAQNAMFNKGGPEALQGLDQHFVTNGLIPFIRQSHDIPTDAVGFLNGMSRSTDPRRALFAYNTLAMMQDADPRAFDLRVPKDLASDVDFWRSHKDSMNEEELMTALRGGNTPERINFTRQLRQDASDILAAKKDGVPKLNELVGNFIGSMDDSWMSDPQNVDLPVAAQALYADFQKEFIDNYVKTGNVDSATALTVKSMQREWGVSHLGGRSTLMKYQPEKYYQPSLGSFDWIDAQARQELGLKEGESFQLISDGQTRDEVKGGQLPSYQVVRLDAAGTPYLVMDDRKGHEGQPRRIFFEKDDTIKADEDRDYQRKLIGADLLRADEDLQRAQRDYSRIGQTVPEEFIQRRDELKRQYDELAPKAPPLTEKDIPFFPELTGP